MSVHTQSFSFHHRCQTMVQSPKSKVAFPHTGSLKRFIMLCFHNFYALVEWAAALNGQPHCICDLSA